MRGGTSGTRIDSAVLDWLDGGPAPDRPVLRAAVSRGAVHVPESGVHRIESAARPDLGLLELLRELSGGHEVTGNPC